MDFQENCLGFRRLFGETALDRARCAPKRGFSHTDDVLRDGVLACCPNLLESRGQPKVHRKMAGTKLPFALDEGAGGTAALGLIVLQNDETLESELSTIFGDGAGVLYHARIASSEEVTPETLRAMERNLPLTLSLLPTSRPLDVVAYACTSGATLIGQNRVAELIRSIHPGCRSTDPITAVMAACGELGVRRLGFITPYVPDVSAAMQRLLESEGLEIADFASFEQSQEAVVARITPASVLEAICAVGRNEAVDAVFVSCTNLRTFAILDAAETRIAKPVISSNAALGWHLRKLARLAPPPSAPGRLLRT